MFKGVLKNIFSVKQLLGEKIGFNFYLLLPT